MPHYEFYCRACKKSFAQILRLVDYEEGDVVCPRCGSREVEQRWSAISVLASRKSA
jgi:putative FmdB family regulatory protein